MKHVKCKTKKVPLRADTKVPIEEIDPCLGLSGAELKKCRKKNPED